MRNGRKEPLYRKVNTVARGVHHPFGGEYRWQRNGKAEATATADGVARGKMRPSTRRGMFDYTPLFRFLLSKVGQDWQTVYSEAVARLDHPDPMFRMVALRPEDRRRFFCWTDNTYFSGLYVDPDNRLALVDPHLTVADMRPDCPCCTHTLNGVPFEGVFDPDNRMGPQDWTPVSPK